MSFKRLWRCTPPSAWTQRPLRCKTSKASEGAASSRVALDAAGPSRPSSCYAMKARLGDGSKIPRRTMWPPEQGGIFGCVRCRRFSTAAAFSQQSHQSTRLNEVSASLSEDFDVSKSKEETSNRKTKAVSITRTLARKHDLPVFSVNSEEIHLIEHPKAFYKELLGIISRARSQLYLATLYIGKSEHGLIEAVASALERNPKLQVTIIVDSLRSTREGQYEGTDSSASCASLLAKLTARFPDQCYVRTFRAPGLPSWLERLVGKRFVEGWGLQHMKIYASDDEAIISGANLSNDYFTNRRDRYVRVRDAELSSYARAIAHIAARYSYRLVPDQALHGGTKSADQFNSPYMLHWDPIGLRLRHWIVPRGVETDSQQFSGAMRRSIKRMTLQTMRKLRQSPAKDVDIVFLLQMGPLNVSHETDIVPQVLAAANAEGGSHLDFTTGYFSPNPLYARQILDGTFSCKMITAAPQSNGFFGSKGVSKHLPPGYTWLTRRFWKQLVRRGRDKDVVIYEWAKPGWTYHAKGLWLYARSARNPYLTLLGSSNFGSRSAERDLECTLLIDASRSPDLQRRLGDEARTLAADATDRVGPELFARPERHVSLGVKIAAYLLRKLL